ncbi:Ger(x)C family spore germination protein [Paenibacillus filicis]|uniref:Ger(X)C family spore germination protein n=1 Tax=Paenibacillus filicis TaxID=669464 RepID=A0ABU9DKV8_9BACL
MSFRGGRILWILLLPMLLGGCWDVKDINKRYLPVVMGIDQEKTGNYKIILQVPTVEGGTQMLEGESASISKAVDLIRTKAEKSVDLVHLRLFLISENMARKGIKEVMDYAVRANDISIKSMVAIVHGDFEKTLYHQIKPTPEVSAYDYFSEESGWTPNVSINRVWEAYRSAYSYTEDFAIPLVEAGKRTLFNFSGSAIMRRDRMVGMLTPDETLINNVFQEKYTGGTIEITNEASVIIKKVSVRHHTDWLATGPSLTSMVYMNVVIAENKRNRTNQEVANDIERLLEKRSKAIFEKLGDLKADILGAGQLFRPRMSAGQLKDWKNVWFPKMKHTVTVKVNVLNNIDLKENVK